MNEKSIAKIKKLKEKYNELEEKIKAAKEEQKLCIKKISEIENGEKLNLIKSMSSADLEKILELHDLTEQSGMTISDVAELLGNDKEDKTNA